MSDDHLFRLSSHNVSASSSEAPWGSSCFLANSGADSLGVGSVVLNASPPHLDCLDNTTHRDDPTGDQEGDDTWWRNVCDDTYPFAGFNYSSPLSPDASIQCDMPANSTTTANYGTQVRAGDSGLPESEESVHSSARLVMG